MTCCSPSVFIFSSSRVPCEQCEDLTLETVVAVDAGLRCQAGQAIVSSACTQCQLKALAYGAAAKDLIQQGGFREKFVQCLCKNI